MKRVIVGLIVIFAASVSMLGFWSPAQAYPDTPPTDQTTRVEGTAPDSSQAAPAATESSLPSTGGPNMGLLGGGTALVLAGGVVVFVAARRQTS